MGVSSLRLILSGDNLFLWSKMYEDMDAAQLGYSGMTRHISDNEACYCWIKLQFVIIIL